jgi:hypothetical protein
VPRPRIFFICLLGALACAGPAQATRWGMGIAASDMTSPLFRDLGLRDVRLVTAWDAVFTDRERLDEWLHAARVNGLRPLVAFNHSAADICPAPCAAPSLRRYRRARAAFHRRYPWVTQLSPWNEANHGTQPTARRPELAARYSRVARSVCPRCTIVTADVLDSHNMKRWMKRFLRALGRPPEIIGLHNYSDVNHLRSTATRTLMRMTHARIWLTETGGVVTLRAHGDVSPLRERVAAVALNYLFDMVRSQPRIERVYLYQWRRVQRFDLFDAGLLRTDGTPRPGYVVVRDRLKGSR